MRKLKLKTLRGFSQDLTVSPSSPETEAHLCLNQNPCRSYCAINPREDKDVQENV